MKSKLIWIGLSIVMTVATPLSMAQTVNAAIPPLSSQSLNGLSDYIVIGKVTQVEIGKSPSGFATREHYKVLFKVEKVESKRRKVVSTNGEISPLINPIRPGSTIEVHYRQVGNRPTGWSGSQGQNSHLKEGITAKLFIRQDLQGLLHLLEPNGWEPIDREAVK